MLDLCQYLPDILQLRGIAVSICKHRGRIVVLRAVECIRVRHLVIRRVLHLATDVGLLRFVQIGQSVSLILQHHAKLFQIDISSLRCLLHSIRYLSCAAGDIRCRPGRERPN